MDALTFRCGHDKTPENTKVAHAKRGLVRCRQCHKRANRRTQKARDARYLAKPETKKNRARLQREFSARNRYKIALKWRIRNGWAHDLAMLKPLKQVSRANAG